MFIRDRGPRTRRGVTLVEMLVTVAVLVILMTILVQIFQAATGSVSAAQAYQQLDDQLRRIDGIIRADLEGVTAKLTPPLDPSQNLGYFEYGENEFADSQGEDSDDYIRFTAKAPEGRSFTGRMWIAAPGTAMGFYNGTVQPVTVTSEYAEIIYFVRSGNLYRRVLLVNPQLQSTIVPALNNLGYNPAGGTYNFLSSYLANGSILSWQGVNDLSARPAATGPNMVAINQLPAAQQGLTQARQTIVLNSLGDLTNRENRAFSPRFSNDFTNNASGYPPAGLPDGFPDDVNGDNVPDLYPSLYSGVYNPLNPISGTWQLIFEPSIFPNQAGDAFMAFPWVFPGAYSRPQTLNNYALGWIHSPTPAARNFSGNVYQFDTNPLGYLQNMNHNPLDLGDNLPTPLSTGNAAGKQTWWGFPTWRETLSPNWTDPTIAVNVAGAQPRGLVPPTAALLTNGSMETAPPNPNLLPPMLSSFTYGNGTVIPLRALGSMFNDNQFSDGAGTGSAFLLTSAGAPNPLLWTQSWEDDLIMTGVRSFDVKAYDNALAGYADLGWGDDVRTSGYTGTPFLAGNPDYSGNNTPVYPPLVAIQGGFWDYINQTFAHEGRMPPLVEDNRLDAQYPNPSYLRYDIQPAQQYANISDPVAGNFNFSNYTSNIGDDNPGIVRLRRVWDSWSTEYTRAPATGIYNNPNNPPGSNTPDPLNGFPWGPPFSPPIYPSYPPPYPAPLRGIQIQLRVVDPTSQRIKSLTIRQDFTDKL